MGTSDNRILEGYIPGSSLISITDKTDEVLKKMAKSVGKVIIGEGIGTGFFLNLLNNGKIFNCFISCQHVINEEYIEGKKKIKIIYNNNEDILKFELDKDKRIIYNFEEKLEIDAIVIEILPDDKVPEDLFLKPYLDYIDNYNDLKDKEIYIIQFPKGEELKCSEGKISSIEKSQFSHSATTQEGSSGSPIILKSIKKIVGIHKWGDKFKRVNYGDFLYPIIKFLEGNKKAKLNKSFPFVPVVYKGDMVNGKRQGKGKCIFKDKYYYEGDWFDDKMHGKGTLYFPDGKILYEGDFINNEKEGYGKYYYLDGPYYIGQWVKDKKHGKGIIYSEEGKIIYEGEFENDKKKGYGKYFDKNGDLYIGQWADDKMNGDGKIYNKNGNLKLEGEFENGRLKIGIQYDDNGDISLIAQKNYNY